MGWLSNFFYVCRTLFSVAILVRVFLSWTSAGQNSAIGNIVYSVTEPVLAPIRHLLSKTPLGGGMMDFSPILALFIVDFVLRLLEAVCIMVLL